MVKRDRSTAGAAHGEAIAMKPPMAPSRKSKRLLFKNTLNNVEAKKSIAVEIANSDSVGPYGRVVELVEECQNDLMAKVLFMGSLDLAFKQTSDPRSIVYSKPEVKESKILTLPKKRTKSTDFFEPETKKSPPKKNGKVKTNGLIPSTQPQPCQIPTLQSLCVHVITKQMKELQAQKEAVFHTRTRTPAGSKKLDDISSIEDDVPEFWLSYEEMVNKDTRSSDKGSPESFNNDDSAEYRECVERLLKLGVKIQFHDVSSLDPSVQELLSDPSRFNSKNNNSDNPNAFNLEESDQWQNWGEFMRKFTADGTIHGAKSVLENSRDLWTSKITNGPVGVRAKLQDVLV